MLISSVLSSGGHPLIPLHTAIINSICGRTFSAPAHRSKGLLLAAQATGAESVHPQKETLETEGREKAAF